MGRASQRAREATLRLPPLRWREERIAELRDANRELRATHRESREEHRHLQRRLVAAQEESTRLQSELDAVRAGALRERAAAEARLSSVQAEGAARVREARTKPSFGAHLYADRRVFDETRRAVTSGGDLAHAPRVELMNKLKAYRFAESHGVLVPEVHAVWADLEAIDWDALPDAFVLKSAGGFSSHGVYPLQRVAGGFQVLGQDTLRTPEDIVDALRRKVELRRVRGPWFAEALLEERTQPGVLPTDHKIYAFYGEVGHVLLRRMTQHGNTRLAHWQYLDRDGGDLGDVAEGRTVNPDLPTPPNLSEMVELAERLSVAVPTPMIRVDLYDTSEGVRLGEFTVMPGGKQHYRVDHDLALGTLWDRAAGRLQRDLTNGRPFALLRGDHPVRTPLEPTRAYGVSRAR